MKIHSFFVALSTSVALATPFYPRQAGRPSVTVTQGILTGTTTTFPSATATVNQFLGIPFGAKPERFATPTAASAWSGTYDATKYKDVCIQQFSYISAFGVDFRELTIKVFDTPGPQANESEDCLNLNVFAPSTASTSNLKPVMFWIYGGAFAFGANSLPMYDGSHFAAEQDILVVTINYRTNIFGFPGYPSQPKGELNLGLLDQRLALTWVYKNIEAFGGDPQKITLFGESAGAGSVDALVTLPPDPLPFRAAIMESGQATFANSYYLPNQNNKSQIAWNNLAANLSLSPQDAIPIIKKMDAVVLKDKIEHLALEWYATKGDDVTWSSTPRQNRNQSPTDGGKKFAAVPLLIGSNGDEGSFYQYFGTPQNKLDYTDLAFQCPAQLVAQETSPKNNGQTWRYYFNASFPNNRPFPNSGAFHSSEIPEVFGTYNRNGATQRQSDISKAMMKAWADFAKNPSQGPGWNAVPKVQVYDGSENKDAQYEVDEAIIDGGRCKALRSSYDAWFPA